LTFVQAFIKEVEANYAGGVPISFGTANAPPVPFIAVIIVPPADEDGFMLCDDQGDGGTVTLQWSLAAHDFPSAYNALETLKQIVQPIRGKIGSAPDEYYVEANRTGGITSLDAALGSWSALFESPLQWSRV
jgi:hypothetical protein